MTQETWVINASPLITLGKVGRLDLLSEPQRRLVIPQAVVDEILAGPPTDPARLSLESGFGDAALPASIDHDVAQWGLGRGESAVLVLGRKLGATVVIDDRDARRAASVLGLSYIGTLGVVLQARRTGRIESAKDVLRALVGQGLRLDDRLVASTLREAFGEIWKAD